MQSPKTGELKTHKSWQIYAHDSRINLQFEFLLVCEYFCVANALLNYSKLPREDEEEEEEANHDEAAI